MEASHKEGSSRPRRSRSAPPDPVESLLPLPGETYDIEIERFIGHAAPLAALAAAYRSALREGHDALICEIGLRLASLLARRGIEALQVVGLLEEARARGVSGALPELFEALCRAGDPERAIECFAAWQREEGHVVRESFDSAAFILEAARVSAQLGDPKQATVALKLALKHLGDAPDKRAPVYERLGSLGFWGGDIESSADAYLLASELGDALGAGPSALDNALRAFELAPHRRDVAESLARKLVVRGRNGAANAILQNHVRRVSAAKRAAFFLRRFQLELSEGNYAKAIGLALEAELDVELDLERVRALLSEPETESPTDFEGLLVYLSMHDILGDREIFGHWTLALIDAHQALWGADVTMGLRSRAIQLFELDSPPLLRAVTAESRAHELRQRLAGPLEVGEVLVVRDEIARVELGRGAIKEAFAVLEPSLEHEAVDLSQAAFWLFVVSRGGELSRARALLELSSWLPKVVGAEMCAVACEILARNGPPDAARRAADRALALDADSERVILARAGVALAFPDIASPEELENSLSLVVASAATCRTLARAAEVRGAYHLALTWSERAVELRPADPRVHDEHLALAIRVRDARRLAEALNRCVRELLPHDLLTEGVSAALLALSELEPAQTAWVIERIVEMPAHVPTLGPLLIQLARALKRADLEARVIEMQLVRAEPGTESLIHRRLSDAWFRAGDAAAAFSAYLRALEMNSTLVEPPSFLARGQVMNLDADSRLCKMELEVALGERSNEPTLGDQYFRLGVARWDMAEDAQGALAAFLRGAERKSQDGYAHLYYHLVRVAGAEKAVELLQSEATCAPTDRLQGRLWSLAARAQLALGHSSQAFQLAQVALEYDPLLAEALAIAERSADEQSLEALEGMYWFVANNSLGAYGERAVCYRAARQLDRRVGPRRAIPFAERAFEAVPAEGVTFVLLTRLAAASETIQTAVGSLERVAARAGSLLEKERFLELAAAMRQGTLGGRTRVEVLLRGLGLGITRRALEDLETELRSALTQDPESRAALAEKVLRRGSELTFSASGPEAVLLGVWFARIAIRVVEDRDTAFDCLLRAVGASLVADEYELLLDDAGIFATDEEKLKELLDGVQRACGDGQPLGRALAEFLGACAHAAGKDSLRAELLVCAATDAPDDASLIEKARDLSHAAGRDDLVDVIEGLLPADLRARSILERGGALSDEEIVDALLEIDLSHAEPALRMRVLEVLARCQERMSLFADARDSWSEVLELDARSSVALSGLERAAERDEDYEALLLVLTRRADAASDPEDARRLHLRRAAVLETHLGRPAEARKLLEEVLERQGDSWAVLRLLADSLERAADYARAAELWSRAQAVATDVEAAADACFRAAVAYHEAGEARRARDALGYVDLGRPECLELKLKVERAMGDPAAVMETLIGLARVRREDKEAVGQLYMEAAEIALKLEVLDIAEECALDAVRLGDNAPAARLLAAQLEVRRLGRVSMEQAKRLLEQLAGTEVLKSSRHRELRAYLLSEVYLALDGVDEARRFLEGAIAELGPRPLLSVALAAHLESEPTRALELYESAAGGDYLHMFSTGEVLLRAGRLARRLRQYGRARAFVSAVPESDPSRNEAAKELEELKRAAQDGKDTVLATAPIDSKSTGFTEQTDMPQGKDEKTERQSEGKIPLSAEERTRLIELARQAEADERVAALAREPDRVDLVAIERLDPERAGARSVSSSGGERRRRLELAALPPWDSAVVGEVVSLSDEMDAHSEDGSGAWGAEVYQDADGEVAPESELVRAFEEGDLGAGQALFDVLIGERHRSRDALLVASHLAVRRPWDAEHLGYLVTAATKDGSDTVALAARHVLGAFGAGEELHAPELEAVWASPEAVGAVLWRGVESKASEALGIVWEHAGGLFRRDLASYEFSNVARIPSSVTTRLAEFYRAAARLLGVGKTPLYRGALDGEIQIQVLLLQPPAVLVSGDVDNITDEFKFHLGAMLHAAEPEHALLYGADGETVEDIFRALALAFGPSLERGAEVQPILSELGARLWETVPVRAQRRLSQLCSDPTLMDRGTAAEASRLVLRRAGLLVCGNIRTAVTDACSQAGIEAPSNMVELARVAAEYPSVADLLTMAISPAYAEIRFRSQGLKRGDADK